MISAADIVRGFSKKKGEATCIRMEGQTVSWSELDAQSSRVANALMAANVGPQERIAFIEKNSIEYFEVLFGCSKANIVDVSVNWRLAPPEIAYTVNDAEAKILIVGVDFFAAIEAIESELTTVQTIVALGEHPRWPNYQDWIGSYEPNDPNVATLENDIAFQLYTSGTTGLPKGVMTSNANFMKLVSSVLGPWGIDETSKNIATMPLFHIGGSRNVRRCRNPTRT
jgi:acyl-CoA synthetase (AMP-forming)/AMP-acid ligase II